MTNTHIDHVDLESLSAYADGELNAVAALRVERHLDECDACRATLARVRTLVSTAAALPRDIAPPPDAWSAIRDRVARPASRVPRRWWHNGWLAAAAAVVLVAGSVLFTRAMTSASRSRPASASSTTTPVVVASMERRFAPTIAELRATLETQRSRLAPSTVRTVERSLAVIDSAIAEAAAALAADPASTVLKSLLAANYGRKIEFLKRATTMSPSL